MSWLIFKFGVIILTMTALVFPLVSYFRRLSDDIIVFPAARIKRIKGYVTWLMATSFGMGYCFSIMLKLLTTG